MGHAEEVELVVTLHTKDRLALLDALQTYGTLLSVVFSDEWTHVKPFDSGVWPKL